MKAQRLRLSSKNAAVLWTGGKDSCLALYEAKLLGYNIRSLVTFIPHKLEFLAHPLHFIKYQAECLALQHVPVEINEPFKEGYEHAIHSLKERYGMSTLITGDIAEVDGYPNWVRECSEYSGVDVITPLWGRDRLELLNQLLSCKFKAIFSCVKQPWFTEEWLGAELNRGSIERLKKIRGETGLDVCGENGEYHTLIVDGPHFKKSIHIRDYLKCVKDSLMYMDIQKVVLQEK